MEGEKGYQKRFWTAEEDEILADYIRVNGKGRWNRLAKMTGLKRCGKSCRLRWINYLSPSIKRGDFSEEEDDLIIRLHNLLGNRWSLIAGRVPGRTDNQIKNYWNTHLGKKLQVINKEKGKSKTGSSSQMESGKVVGNDSFVHKNTSLEQFSQYCVRAEEEKIVETDSENQFGFFEVEEGMANEGCESPFWFSNHDLELINSSSLLELLEPCSLDFFWQGGL